MVGNIVPHGFRIFVSDAKSSMILNIKDEPGFHIDKLCGEQNNSP